MWKVFGIQPFEAMTVVVSAVGIAVVPLLLLRLQGQRPAARMSTFDAAVLLVLGFVGGRVITVYEGGRDVAEFAVVPPKLRLARSDAL